MERYIVMVTEIYERAVSVEADDMKEAEDTVMKLWENDDARVCCAGRDLVSVAAKFTGLREYSEFDDADLDENEAEEEDAEDAEDCSDNAFETIAPGLAEYVVDQISAASTAMMNILPIVDVAQKQGDYNIILNAALVDGSPSSNLLRDLIIQYFKENDLL